MSPLNALFEAVSGITSTGATILTTFNLPKAVFFWRSMSQWLGGMGIIVLFIAILPQFAVAGRQMFFAEAPGPTEDKMTPRIRHTATALWGLYVVYTVIEIILLKIAGMPLFDAFCNSFASISGGGFSPNPLSIHGYNSQIIKWIIIVFMFLAGTNFALMYNALTRRNLPAMLKNDEFRLYFLLIFLFSVCISLILYFQNHYHFFEAVTDGVFQTISIMVTAGFASADYEQWTSGAKILLFVLMFIGGCAGSAAGGLKIVRVAFIIKYLKNEIAKILHPNAVFPIKLDKTTVPQETGQQLIAFIIFYYVVFAVSAFFITIIENDGIVGLTGSITTLGNVGPGFGFLGPMGNFDVLRPASKIICIFNMLVGRLELIPFLAMLHPDFWKIK
jgi:trk system potassium uptake protein TrkH